MTRETVNKLSQLIRDKDLEIQSLVARNESLVTLVHKSGDNSSEKDNKDAIADEDVKEDSNKLLDAGQEGSKKEETQNLKVRKLMLASD